MGVYTHWIVASLGCSVIHPPILVAIARVLHDWTAAPEAKTLVAGSPTGAACLGVTAALLRIPGIPRVL